MIQPVVNDDTAKDDTLLDVLALPVELGEGLSIVPVTRIGCSTIVCGIHNVQNAWNEAEIALQMSSFDNQTIITYSQAIRSNYERRLYVESHFESAMNRSELYVNFQPQCTGEGDLVGFEALARWKSPQFGSIGPDEFIPILERTGQISRLTEFMLKQATLFLSSCYEIYEEISISVNISPCEIGRKRCIERIRKLLDEGVIKSANIVLEITESRYISEDMKVQEYIRELTEMGFRICLDDFGTGYSNLSLFSTIPLEYIKIDKSFLENILKDPYSLRILGSIIDFAFSIDRGVVVEGVEEQEHVDFLIGRGCHVFQGYYFSRPVSYEKAMGMIRRKVNRKRVFA